MSFCERYFNAIVSIYDWAVRRFAYLPTEEEYAKKYFAHLAPLPSLNDLLKSVSLVLVNTHRALSPPRPSMPIKLNLNFDHHHKICSNVHCGFFLSIFACADVISIGGAHIKPAKPLPMDIKQFIDEAKDGVIYFSLGTIVQSSKLPKEKLDAFFGTF